MANPSELVVSFPTCAAAEEAKNKLRRAGVRAYIESTDNSSFHRRKESATRVVVSDDYPQMGSIKDLVGRLLH